MLKQLAPDSLICVLMFVTVWLMRMNDIGTIVRVTIAASTCSLVGGWIQGAWNWELASAGLLLGAYVGVFAVVGLGFWDTEEAKAQAKSDALERKLRAARRRANAEHAKATLRRAQQLLVLLALQYGRLARAPDHGTPRVVSSSIATA